MTVHKIFPVWDFEKEERWLNEMVQQGWLLDKVGWCTYHFIPCEPDSYTIRLERREKDPAYIGFMEETGAEYVGSCVSWLYFRKSSEHGGFELFSDLQSRIDHLASIGKMLWLIGLANLLIGVANILNGHTASLLNLLVATLIMYGLGRIHGKKDYLEQERALRE